MDVDHRPRPSWEAQIAEVGAEWGRISWPRARFFVVVSDIKDVAKAVGSRQLSSSKAGASRSG